MSKNTRQLNFLPNERPPISQLILYSIQQLIVIFPATVTVALLVGFDVAVTIFASGFATICFAAITRFKLPLYFGSSFSYISAIIALIASQTDKGASQADAIRIAQFGIICSGFVSIIAGIVINRFGEKFINRVLPPIITGSIAMIIGLSLAGSTIDNLVGYAPQTPTGNAHFIVGVITLLAIIIFSLTLKGIPGQIPILFGVLVGYVVSVIVTLTTSYTLIDFGAIAKAPLVAWPAFTLPKFDLVALLAITPIAIATIPESSAHLFQLDMYVDELAKERKKESYGIKKKLGLNLIGDGIADIAASVFGGPGGTSYGESLATQTMTKNFSVHTIIGAAILAILVSFFGGVSAAINSIPMGVVGGVSVYAFGFIAIQGLKLLFENKVDVGNGKNVAILAVVFIVGLAGNIPVFGVDFPAIATAAILGIVLNLVLPDPDKSKAAASGAPSAKKAKKAGKGK